MRTLVTGGTGFIGRRVVELLLAGGHEVNSLCRSPAPGGPRGLTVCAGDILDYDSLVRAAAGCESVFHIAAYARSHSRDPAEFVRVNVGGTENVLAAAEKAGVKRVLVTSTAVVFGPAAGAVVDEGTRRTVEPLTEYERSKILAVTAARRFIDRGLEVVFVNPSRVFGPGPLGENNFVAQMVNQYLDGTWRLILGDGRAVGNYAFVEDVARGHLLAWERGRSGEQYILGGDNVSYDGFFETLAAVSGVRRVMFHVPAAAVFAMARAETLRARIFGGTPRLASDWMRTFLADWAVSSAKAKTELGYTPRSLQEALGQTVAWLRGGRVP